MKIYFANGLFSLADLEFNESVVKRIRELYRKNVEVYLPQENGEINDKQAYANSVQIAQGDNAELLSSDLVFAVLDGAVIDAGVSAEIGIAWAKGIPVIGLYTDTRQQGGTNVKKLKALQELAESQFSYINLFVVGLIKQNGILVNNVDDAVGAIKNYLN